MFHGSRDKVWNSNHILLGERVRDIKVVREEVGDVGPDIQGVLDSGVLLWGGVHSEQGLVSVG